MLIIYAHPNHDGHCGHALKKTQERLDSQKTNYQVLDLYKLNYDPILKAGEQYTSGHDETTQETKKYQKLIKDADKILIIYPTWWNSTPAILKGFFDRVLTRGFAFSFSKKGIPKGFLTGKAAAITATGGSVFVEKVLMGNRSLNAVVKDTLKFCGLRAKGFMIGGASELTEKNKQKVQKKVVSVLKYLS